MKRELPTVVLIGRPNVGKSSLFNALLGAKRAIVHPMPGVTRDWIEGICERDVFSCRLIDTGGIEKDSEEQSRQKVREAEKRAILREGVFAQTMAALEFADVVILVVDAKEGIHSADREILERVRKNGESKPILCAVNKADTERLINQGAEFYQLGVETVFVTAAHRRGLNELLETAQRIYRESQSHSFSSSEASSVLLRAESEVSPLLLRAGGEAPSREAPSHFLGRPPVVVILGRPNVGKSTILNKILGENRSLVSDQPGTTRDSIFADVVRNGKSYRFVDTAGLRRKARITDQVETLSAGFAIRVLEQADVAILLLDSTEHDEFDPIAEQELRLASLAQRRGVGLIFAFNKWDVIERTEKEFERRVEALAAFTPNYAHVPIVSLSGKTGLRVEKLFEKIDLVATERNKRISTGELNKILQSDLERFPGRVSGKSIRAPYLVQVGVNPPQFACFAKGPSARSQQLKRFLDSAVREHWGFSGAPIQWIFKAASKEKVERSRLVALS